MEVNQFTGSFKERGARFALMNMSEEDKRHGVFAASAGNHALALSIHGKKLGIPVTVIMPRHAPLMKITKCQELGSNVIVEGKDLVYARQKALTLAKESGGKYINGYDHIDILAGAGTVGIEIIDQIGDVDAILVPTGGCGLLAGLATAVKGLAPQTKIISLVPETCPSFKVREDSAARSRILKQAHEFSKFERSGPVCLHFPPKTCLNFDPQAWKKKANVWKTGRSPSLQ